MKETTHPKQGAFSFLLRRNEIRSENEKQTETGNETQEETEIADCQKRVSILFRISKGKSGAGT
jgi:hypothetical protein